MIESADSNSTHRAVRRMPPLRQHRLWQLSLVRTLLLGSTDPGSLLWPLRLEDRTEPLLDAILGLAIPQWESEVLSLVFERQERCSCC